MSPYSSQIGGMGCAFVRGALVRESPAPDDSGPVANPYSTVTLGVRVGGASTTSDSLSLFSERSIRRTGLARPSTLVV